MLDGLGWRLGDLPPHEQDLLIVESFARLMAAVEPPIRRDDLPPSYWEVVDEAAVLRLAATGHPELLDVLDAIGSGHPQGRVRKAAKKAAHELRVGRWSPSPRPDRRVRPASLRRATPPHLPCSTTRKEHSFAGWDRRADPTRLVVRPNER
ncbi:MAG: hypothetical protein ACXV3S_06280 [Kineosporiaceae bacterium]